MFELAVDAGVGGDAHEMELAAGIADGEACWRRTLLGFKETTGSYRLGDAHGVLVDDAPGTEVLVTDFGVAHGPFGEPHILATGFDEGGGPVAFEPRRRRGWWRA